MDLLNPDKSEWPFEARIEYSGGREYSQFARDNGDGTVSYISWDEGPTIKTVPKSQAVLNERPWDKAKRWQDLYAEVYGKKQAENKFTEESLQKFLQAGRELVAKGELPESHLAELTEMEEDFRNKTPEDWDDYNFFFTHFPADATDHTLLIARGHFLIARKITALGTPDHIPERLFPMLRKLTSLRERVVRGASTDALAGQINDFLAEFRHVSLPDDRGEALGVAIRHLYGAICGLGQIARQRPPGTEDPLGGSS